MESIKLGRDGCLCPLQQSCMVLHGEHQSPMEGAMPSYQALSMVQGEARVHMWEGGERRGHGCMEVHGVVVHFHLAGLLHEGR